jgi:hypothetical protein
MSYINTTTPTRIWVKSKEYTEFLISGSVSDESTLSASIAKTSGTITLGGVHNSILIKEFPLAIGSPIIVQCTLPNNRSARHPRGSLYLVNTTINYEEQTVTLEVGCSLYLASVYESSFKQRVKSLFNFIPESYDVFDVKNFDLSELSSVLQSLGYVMYQDKYGRVQCVKVFGGASFGSASGSSKFTCYDNSTAISIESLSDTSSLIDPSELTITMSWDIPVFEEKDPEEEGTDTDGDGIPDDEDDDDDGDGIPDDEDSDTPEEEELADDDDPESESDPLNPKNLEKDTEPEIQFLSTKYFQLLSEEECLKIYDGKIYTANPGKIYECGKFLNPQYTSDQTAAANDACKKRLTKAEWINSDSTVDWAYFVEGSLKTNENAYFGDQVKKYQYSQYQGPGNQLSFETTWEEMSVWRAGDAAISQWFENCSKEFDLAVEEANTLSSEMNEYARLRDENDISLKTAQEKICLKVDEMSQMAATKGFYDCLFADRANSRDSRIQYAQAVRNLVANELIDIFGWKTRTNRRTRKINFGSGGEIRSVIEQEFIYSGGSKFTVDLIKRAGEILEKPEGDGRLVDNRGERRSGKYTFGPPLKKILHNANAQEKAADPGGFTVAGTSYDGWPLEFLKSETLEEYFYGLDGAGTVTQKITKIDYENPDNNTVDIKISTDNSTAAAAEPRNEKDILDDKDQDGDGIPDDEDPDQDGDGIPNETDPDRDGDGDPNETDPDPDDPSVSSDNELGSCSIPTETREVVYRMALGNRTETLPGSWLGGFSPSPEEISMPISFKPLIPEELQDKTEDELTEISCNILTSNFIRTATFNMFKYENYINKYLVVEVAKRKMDNRGIRVVEKMRPELFEYYPFMPITIVINANNKTLLARTSAATWAFDSTNALCSLDCYVLN